MLSEEEEKILLDNSCWTCGETISAGYGTFCGARCRDAEKPDETIDADWCKFFGEPWSSGLCDDGRRVPTPVGKICNLCRETIEADHRGSFVNCLDGQGFAHPVHRECSLRSAVGGIGHLEDCAKWCNELHAPDGGRSYRQSALEVWERWGKKEKS